MEPIPSFFDQFSSAVKEIISAQCQLETYKEGEYLHPANKTLKRLFWVKKGVVRIGSINEKGVDLTHYFYDEEHLVAIVQSFDEEIPTEAFIQASCDAEIYSVTREVLLDLYQQFPVIRQAINGEIKRHMIEKINVRNQYLGLEAEEKYRHFLNSQPGIAKRVPLRHIAEYLGITPQSLSRIRRQIR
ncbi:MAG TPA: Crp/Fnr family transcriptional regulator [Pedobacter sp.]|uniref:Crp/Fnr family transcriptional regulator n=1 Tax=Pedobacter sp. TaxID=1411316 RepID=UPI002B7B4B58|nr:Crp/Fnr family transcriptional regulator [Pedobacter sp.]HMI01030.1 Crp/Fnr family transcriptional regulator [Pedobacter sp.]